MEKKIKHICFQCKKKFDAQVMRRKHFFNRPMRWICKHCDDTIYTPGLSDY